VNKLDNCPFCGGQIYNRKFVSFSFDVCRRCKIAQTKPTPSNVDYSKNDFQAQFNFTSLDELNPIWKKSIYKQINLLRKNLRKGSKIFEIGCGQGIILNELRKNGYCVKGIEPSKEAVKRAVYSGLDVIEGYFPNIKLADSKFDAIISSHVLEYIKNPTSFIKKISSILSPGGLLMFTQTNYLGLIPRVRKEHWYAWTPEQHYWHFSVIGLRSFLAGFGYSRVETKYTSLVHPDGLLLRLSDVIPSWRDQFHLLVKKNNIIL
jgi:2-polyprenyl-3-methyl-5-hydroxy-6-metoxy-1,4-benzoquinol methylase